jgi:hypothetical protein
MKLEYLKKNAGLFRRFTGLKVEEFDELFDKLVPIYEENERLRLGREDRVRPIGGGAQFKMDLENRLLMTLLYYKLYVTHEFLGLLFGMHNCNVSRCVRHLSPLLAKIFRVPERKIKLSESEKDEITRYFIDATERPINRPKNGKKQKKHYSGKKKTHTVKLQVVTRDGKRIEALSKTYPGSVHDKKIYDDVGLALPENAKGIGDTGYEGTDLTRPVKKKKGKERSKAQKKFNRKISKIRIKAEHAIGRMKRFRIVRDVFRNPLKTHDLYAKNIAGLLNFSLDFQAA